MFDTYVFSKLHGNQINKILIFDSDGLDAKTHYRNIFAKNNYKTIDFTDDLSFRIKYSNDVKNENTRIVVFADEKQYIPYDILKRFTVLNVNYELLFPRLNSTVLKSRLLDFDLLSIAYEELYENLTSSAATTNFINEVVYGVDNVQKYCTMLNEELRVLVKNVHSYKEWCKIARIKAHIDVYCAKYRIPIITDYINSEFKEFIFSSFGKLSGNLDNDSPILVSKAMDYMHSKSDKFAIVVMDGMSEFDWEILSESFDNLPYERESAFAMIPTITSISRQCLLSNKYPSQLQNPWGQSKEKAEFITCARSLGYTDVQIGYERGYDASFPLSVKCAAVIINDIDDLVHAQKHGREGMYDDVSYLAKTGKLASLCRRLIAAGFDVYISADHGNALCRGLGKLIKSGVETESKSHRMVVLNQVADKKGIQEKYSMLEYPKYYLDKQYDYLICDNGTSLDNKDEIVMSHGGVSIEEVVVPFIKMKASVL